MKAVAVDAMGGDHAPGAVVEGAVQAARELGLSVVLVGREELIRSELSRHVVTGLPISIQHAPEIVTMEDSPVEALRRKRKNSMRLALDLVKSGEACGFVSAGNSGAAMASAVMALGNLPGVNRPAIALEVPAPRRPVTLLDAGANAECVPLNLVQFAVMGEIAARNLRGIPAPRVGLLSNGEEEGKGTDLTRAADQALRQMPLNYVGYIEGRDLNAGKVDVAVTDGFTGNVVLKTMEGLGKFLGQHLRQTFESNWRTRLGYLLVRKELDSLRRILDYDSVGGAPLLGLNGVTIIAHGSSSPKAIRNAIRVAADTAGKNVNAQILDGLQAIPEMVELDGALKRKRGGFWQQIRGRFRQGRDGKDVREGHEVLEDEPIALPAPDEKDPKVP